MRIYLLEVIDEDRVDNVEVLYPPIGLGYLAGFIQRRYLDWEIQIGRGGVSVLPEIEEFLPDVIGVGFVTQNAMRAVDVVRGIAAWGHHIPIVVGGHHVTAFPWWMDSMVEYPLVFSVSGEGEVPFAIICEHVSRGLDMESPWFQSIMGVGYRSGDGYEMVMRNSVVAPLDRMPQPAWDLFCYNGVDAQIFTSRGCAFDCTFCSSACFWGKPRYYSPKRVVQDIKTLHVEHGIMNFNIFDDLFAMNKKRVIAILKFMQKDSVIRNAGLVFSCLGRASVMDVEMAGLLKEMGVQNIAFGFESGSDEILKKLKGPTASVEGNYRAADIIRSAEIGLVGSVIYGVPGETKKDVEATLKMVKELKLKTGEAYLATPYPGTQMWADAERRGLVSDDMDFSRLRSDWGDDAVIISDEFSIDELKVYKERFNDLF